MDIRIEALARHWRKFRQTPPSARYCGGRTNDNDNKVGTSIDIKFHAKCDRKLVYLLALLLLI